MSIRHDKSLQALADKLTHEQLAALADEICQSTYDGDGCTTYEFFGWGFELAERAAGVPVFAIDSEDAEGTTVVCLLIGDEGIVRQKLAAS